MVDVGLILRQLGAPIPARGGLVIDCSLIRKHRAQGVKRAFFHVGHRGGWIVCAAIEAGYLPDEHLYALVLHEYGHPLAWKMWGRSEQHHADWAAHLFTRIPILYRSSLTLQWITPTDARRLKLPASLRRGRVRAFARKKRAFARRAR